jgi:hypothetical protein
MKKRTLIVMLGVWIVLVPLFGLPNIWKNRLTIISGLLVIAVASMETRPNQNYYQDSVHHTTQEITPAVHESITPIAISKPKVTRPRKPKVAAQPSVDTPSEISSTSVQYEVSEDNLPG